MKYGFALVAALAALLSAGCADDADAPVADAPAAAAPAPAADATSPFTPYAEAPAETAAAPARVAGAPVADGVKTFEFWFSAKTANDDPRVVQWIEDPCGPTPVAVVDSIPLDDPYLLPDFVVEFAADGRELRKWGKPFSAEILTVDDEHLYFRSTTEQGSGADFRTDAAGTIVVLAEPVAATVSASAQEVDCPALPAFEGADFVQCYEVADADGRKRLLAWEGACS